MVSNLQTWIHQGTAKSIYDFYIDDSHFLLYLSFQCEKDENKQKEAEFGSYLNTHGADNSFPIRMSFLQLGRSR